MTAQTKFTKGPWMVGGVRCKIERHDSHSILRYDADKKRDETIANVWYDPKTGLGRADAHLIAAAPDLYAALDELADLMEAVRGGDYMPDSFTCQPAQIALAKARGQA